MPDTQSEPRMQCRHVFTDGHRCASPCLRHEPFCYYHHTTRRPVQNLPARRRRSATFTLPELEDRAAIQLALSEILQRIASNDIDPKRAGHLLFGIQIATSLLPKPDPKDKTQPKTVAEITHDEELGDLAPAAEVGHDRQLEQWEIDLNKIIKSATPKDPEPQPEPEPVEDAEVEAEETLPCIQAAAERRPFRVASLRTHSMHAVVRGRCHLHSGHRLHIRHVLLHPGHRLRTRDLAAIRQASVAVGQQERHPAS